LRRKEVASMKSARKSSIILLAFLLVSVVFGNTRSEEKRAYIDPGFELLLKLYPRNKEIVNPMVSRISAKTAFGLYGGGKAIFFAAGGESQALIPGAIRLTGPMEDDPPLRFLKENENKIIVIYCH
jgi:hypothetical protein